MARKTGTVIDSSRKTLANLEESNNNNISRLLKILDIRVSGEGLGNWSSLLFQPSDDGISVASSGVLGWLSVTEKLDGWVSANLRKKDNSYATA